jgi:hypothetical protein
VAPADGVESAQLKLVAPGGRAVLTMPEGEGVWNLELQIGGQRADRQWPAWNPAQAALEQLRGAVFGQPVQLEWLDGARSIELTETIDRSLARGRTIELHHEEYNEAGAFKSMMAASGCGLLLLGIFLLVVVGVVEDLGRAIRLPMPHLADWPYLLLAVLAIFLLLQLLLLLLRRDSKPKE